MLWRNGRRRLGAALKGGDWLDHSMRRGRDLRGFQKFINSFLVLA